MIKIPIAKPYLDDKEQKAVLKVINSGWLTQGRMVSEFEGSLTSYTRAKYAVATSSCTTALHLSLIALKIGKGDEVIVPSFTFVATANVVEYTGAKPVFSDIDINTFNIDVNKIESLITKRTKAIIPVHLFGLCADMGPILDIAKKHSLFVLEDAACGLGAFYHGKSAGTFGKIGCFSFHPRKSVTTGEGGVAVTDNFKISNTLIALRNHGASKSDYVRHKSNDRLLPDFNILGFNFRMTDIQAAIGVWQMKKIRRFLRIRQEIAKQYDIVLKALPWLNVPHVPEGFKHGYQSYVCMVNKAFFGNNLKQANKFRNGLMENLEHVGISTRQGTHAVHNLCFYREKYGYIDMDFPNSFDADKLSLALPLYAGLSERKQMYVVKNIISIGSKLLNT